MKIIEIHNTTNVILYVSKKMRFHAWKTPLENRISF